MNNLIQNYEIIRFHLQQTCSDIESFRQARTPKLGNLELVSLNLTAEYMSINTELQLFRCIKGTYLEPLIERSVYNKRRRRLLDYTEAIRRRLSGKFADLTDLFVVDSMPTPICKLPRAGRSGICATDRVQPSFGYCASQMLHYFGYKTHAVCDRNGVFHSFDLTPAHVHEVNYLADVKHDFSNCTMLGDRGYIGAGYQADLFTHSQITLSVPMRKNQAGFVPYPKAKAKVRRRIETAFSQLHGQFQWVVNHAKTFPGLATRLLSKITAYTMIQYLNLFVFNRTINHIKVNLF